MVPWSSVASSYPYAKSDASDKCAEKTDSDTVYLKAPEEFEPVPNELEQCWVHEVNRLRHLLADDFRSYFQDCHTEYKTLIQQHDCLLQRFAEHLASCSTLSKTNDDSYAAFATRSRGTCRMRATQALQQQQLQLHAQQQQQQHHPQLMFSSQPSSDNLHDPPIRPTEIRQTERPSGMFSMAKVWENDTVSSKNNTEGANDNDGQNSQASDGDNKGHRNAKVHQRRTLTKQEAGDPPPAPFFVPNIVWRNGTGGGGGLEKQHTKCVFDFATRLDKTSLAEEEYNVWNLYKDTGWAQYLTRHDGMAKLSFVMILTNAAFIGIDLDTNTADTLITSDWYYQVCEQVFCAFFTIELLLRFFAFRVKLHCLVDLWFRFDAALVLMMVVETWMIPALMLTVGFPTLPKGPNKLLRLFRLARMTRLAKALPELIIMIKGMQTAARAVLSSMMMLGLLIYVFSAIMLTFLSNEPLLSQHFGSLLRCMWTLLMEGTFLDNTGELLVVMLDLNYYRMVACFLFFILLSALLVMNMLIGVLCEVVSSTAQAEKDANAISMVKQSLLSLFKEFDADNSGTITLEELDGVMGCGESLRVFQDLNINVEYFLEYAQMLFEEPGTEMPIEDVMELVLKMRGDTPSKAEDIITSNLFTHWKVQRIMCEMLEEYNAAVVRGLPAALNTLRTLGDVTGQPFIPARHSELKSSPNSPS